ncbi:MAG: ABC transporter ATP-binding protein [Pirellulaceae bacterium]|jgi:ABC-2 type transport system ATP-binding protein|nr:ABC transporter ATP-binding protein [Pirellulaceae bacterium]
MGDHAAIEVEELGKTYRDGLLRRRAFAALRGVTFQVQRGEIFGLLGPNGAGKTTLVKLLLGIVRTTQGSARMLGRPAGDRAARRRVGYLPENLRIPRHHTALTALDLFGQMSGLTRGEIRERSGPLLASVDLADRAHDSVRKYSKGMLQRLGLAIALLHQPELIFLDEPTDGLDPPGRAHVRQTLVQLKQEGKTIFLNSHLLQEVELVCDRVAILDHGVLKGLGTVEQLVPYRGEGFELQVQVAGPEPAVRAALAGRPAPRIEPLSSEQAMVHLPVRDQADVDQCIDVLRQQGLSIVALGRRRISLEEAFLHVLGLPAPGTDHA